MKKFLIVSVVVMAIAVASWYAWTRFGAGSSGSLSFKVVKVQKGEVVQTVNATGDVQPLQLIQVGTQVSGPVKRLYVDFNSKVKEGDLVAQIDPAIFETNVAQAKANLAKSEAGVEQIRTNLVLSEKELVRNRELASKDLISTSELDTAIAGRDVLLAQLKSAEASVDQTRSALQTAQVNLDYTTIKSPVSGIVIARNVDEGQTVVANMSAQVLFVVATDLKNVKIEATVPEADIGKISEGQNVRFNVDAYPDREFVGSVTQVRLSSSTVQNVVTYTVIIGAENTDEKLYPGMTANITFEVNRRIDVLKVPNAALRFTPDEKFIVQSVVPPVADAAPADKPPAEMGGPDKRDPNIAGPLEQVGNGARPGKGAGLKGFDRSKDVKTGKVWVKTGDGMVKAVSVSIGISDGSFTEVFGKDVSEGMEVVTGTQDKAAETATNTMVNPFVPSRPGPPGRR